MLVCVGNFMWQTYVDFFSGIFILSGNNWNDWQASVVLYCVRVHKLTCKLQFILLGLGWKFPQVTQNYFSQVESWCCLLIKMWSAYNGIKLVVFASATRNECVGVLLCMYCMCVCVLLSRNFPHPSAVYRGPCHLSLTSKAILHIFKCFKQCLWGFRYPYPTHYYMFSSSG